LFGYLLHDDSKAAKHRFGKQCVSDSLYTLVTRNLSNSLKTLSFNWSSSTLMRFVNNPYFVEDDEMITEVTSPKNNFEVTELRMNGPIRLIQSSTIELILRLLNLNSLQLPLTSSKVISKQAKFDESRLTVSTCHDVKQKLSHLYRQVISNACQLNSSSPRESASRLDLMGYYTLSLIQGIRDYLEADAYLQFESVVSSITAADLSMTRVFNAIQILDLPSHISNHSLMKLVKQCLVPVLLILSSEDVFLNPNDKSQVLGYSACMGVLRYPPVHVLLAVYSCRSCTESSTRIQFVVELFTKDLEPSSVGES
jgi:hypothetical protein